MSVRPSLVSLTPLACALTVAFSTFALSAYAQPRADEPTAVQPASYYPQFSHVIQSKILNEPRKVVVQLPKSYQADSTRVYPVIYRLDGAENLPLISSVLENLQANESAPEVIVVGIENVDRLRDFYPTVNEERQGPVGLGGGAAKFLAFIEQELMPLVNQQYRTHDFRVIAGGSAAGVFALYAMQAKPNLFQAHLAYSPAVWWNFGAAVTRTKQFIQTQPNLRGYLYMNIGEEAGIMRERYDDLVHSLQQHKPKNLKLVTDEFAGVPHNLTATAGVFNAYHHLFMAKQMPLSALTADVSSIDDYYQQLSMQWGETIAPPEQAVRQLGYQLIRAEQYERAIAVFSHNTKLHADSVDAWFGLSYGYEANKDNGKALAALETAIKLADKTYPYFDMLLTAQTRLQSVVLK